MVARGLRWGVAVQALGVALCAFLLVRFAELSPATAAALGFAALLGVYLLFTLATFAICWPRSRNDSSGRTSAFWRHAERSSRSGLPSLLCSA